VKVFLKDEGAIVNKNILIFILATLIVSLTQYTIAIETSQYLSKVSIDWLKSNTQITQPLLTSAFKKSTSAISVESSISGRFILTTIKGTDYFEILKDSYRVNRGQDKFINQLPKLEFDVVQSGSSLVPKVRTIQKSKHPYWEWQISPGIIWQEPNEIGYRRIVFPFSLQERNQNCTHNGVILIALNEHNEPTNSVFQIGSETCTYLQFNLTSRLAVKFNPGLLKNSIEMLEDFTLENSKKILAFTEKDLQEDYPKLDISMLKPTKLSESTTSGVVIKGKHYRLNCNTRFGDYPNCDYLALPSYSTAKNIVGGIGLMRLEKRVPNIGNVLLTKIVPECSEQRWKGVTLNDLINMRTGNYLSKKYMSDESSERVLSFFSATTNSEKLKLSCEMYPHRAKPGKYFTYHTTDTYLAGVMMSRLYIKMTKGNDFYTEMLADRIWKSLNLSPLMNDSKRTYDEDAQPFFGFGLTYLIDDVIKLSTFLQQQVTLDENESLLDQKMLASALRHNDSSVNREGGSPSLAYNYSFWALEVGKTLGCKQAQWIPFMSGFGGITIALISPDLIYYNFSDHNKYQWLDKVVELNRQLSICEV
jgi:hypothetical protein